MGFSIILMRWRVLPVIELSPSRVDLLTGYVMMRFRFPGDLKGFVFPIILLLLLLVWFGLVDRAWVRMLAGAAVSLFFLFFFFSGLCGLHSTGCEGKSRPRFHQSEGYFLFFF